MYASVNEVSISSGNGLLPIWCQDIAETNTDFVTIWTIVNNIHWTLKQNRKTFVGEMSSATCLPFYLSNNGYESVYTAIATKTLLIKMWHIFLCYVYSVVFSHQDVWHHCYALERGCHRGVGLAVTDCTGGFQRAAWGDGVGWWWWVNHRCLASMAFFNHRRNYGMDE